MQKSNSQKVAKEVIKFEISALKKLSKNINQSLSNIIQLILKCKNGKIIISGVGKSGIIARKWAATLSSTGTPSFFMEASDASHGDMGKITSNDVLILISNSGQSEELKNIIQYAARNRYIKLIGITSNKNSILYKNSDVSFLMPNIKEAGPENIVPTSSTISQLALGDAIAIACMKYRNFTKFDFKKFHPSGTLSIKLKTVSDLMIKGKKLPMANENIKMKSAIRIINNKKLGVVIIKKNNGDTRGIITDGDLKRISQKFDNFEEIKVKNLLNKSPISIEEKTLASSALALMNTKKITSLCVHKNNKVKKTIGLIHIHDILRSNIN